MRLTLTSLFIAAAALGTLMPARMPAAASTVPNASFEAAMPYSPSYGADSWYVNGQLMDIRRQSQVVFDGQYAMQIHVPAFGDFSLLAGEYEPAVANADYTVSVMVQGNGTDHVLDLGLAFFDASYNEISAGGITLAVPTTWTREYATSHAPAGTAYLAPLVGNSASAQPQDFYVDLVQLTQVLSPQ